MRPSLRFKLFAIVGTAAGAFLVLIVSSMVIAQLADVQLANVRDRFLPKLEVGPALTQEFEHLRRGIEDAVSAHDVDALAATRASLDEFLATLAGAPRAIDPAAAMALRAAVEDYYGLATDVARRLIAGESGEQLLGAMTAMQASQVRAVEQLRVAVSFNREELMGAFAKATRAEITAARVRLGISVACLALVVLLSYGLGRGVLRALGELNSGLNRFGRGEFGRAIPIVADDELGDVARQANAMADSLQRFADERDRNDWQKGALVGMAQELRGELSSADVARRATSFLAGYLGAPAAALYYAAGRTDGTLRLLGQHALGGAEGLHPAPAFRPGEGLVGQAALRTEITVIDDPPPGYLRVRSGLGEAPPRAIALLPLVHLGRVTGVLELAMFSAWSERLTEVLLSLRESLVIAIEVALAREAMSRLLAETQHQTVRLTEQEEELRANNEVLATQQEELRTINHDLVEQAAQLEAQRRDLERSNAELDEARRKLEQKAAELTTVSAYKSQFLTNMSHELRTPLNSMLLLSNLLAANEQNNLTPKQVEFASTINLAGKDLLSLINQVLDLAKIEAGKHDLNVGTVALVPLAANLRRMFAPLARDKKLEFSVEIAPGLPSALTTDRQRIEQILKNLIANAIKFTEHGSITVRIGPPDATFRPQRAALLVRPAVAFSVTDTGVGIAEADQRRIFAPFEQVDGTPDRRYGGTGLGLSISRELAALLGGEIQLTSALGQGSTFTCVIPVEYDGPAAEEQAAGNPSPEGSGAQKSAPAPSPPVPAGTPPLLVIEDDPLFADALRAVVQSQGFDCLLAPDAQTGLRLARERRPTGILLDIKLPDTDGWRVMELLRADPATARIPVHFVSGTDAPARGLALGAVGFLTKPASALDLQRAVATLVSTRLEGNARVLIVEDDELAGRTLAAVLADAHVEARHVVRGHAALEVLAQEQFGCIVLDLSLPDMDGLEFLQRLRDRYGTAMPAIVIYTARALTRVELEALDGYVEAVVVKEGASSERVLDEVKLFVERVKRGGGARRAGLAPAPGLPDVRIENRTVLLVDDDMRTVYALTALLRSKGAEVLVADNGKEALDALEGRPDVDVVLMDLILPEMDGYQAIARIRKDSRFRDLPIIALTARAMTEEAFQAAGADAYLPKPVDPERLLALLHTRFHKEVVS